MPTETTMREEDFAGLGGVRIHFRSWLPEGEPRAVVAICHGVNSHGGQHAWTAEQLAARGFAVYAVDLRGRGMSEGERFYVEDVDEYVADIGGVIAIAKERHRGLPVYLLGHSAGGVDLLRLRARPPGRDRRADLRKLRLPGAGAGVRAVGDQGAQPRRAAARGADAEDEGLHPRSGGARRRSRRTR